MIITYEVSFEVLTQMRMQCLSAFEGAVQVKSDSSNEANATGICFLQKYMSHTATDTHFTPYHREIHKKDKTITHDYLSQIIIHPILFFV